MDYVLSQIIKILPCIKSTLDFNEVNFISIWGPSGSGKTTIATLIRDQLGNANILSLDRYLSPKLKKMAIFDNKEDTSSIPFLEGLDPKIWDQKLINVHLLKIKDKKAILVPIFNHTTRTREGFEKFQYNKLIIIDGIYSLKNSISNQINYKILINSNFHDRFIRKLVRTTCSYNRNDLDESIERYINCTQPAAEYYYKKYSKECNIIINNPMHPIQEFKRYYKERLLIPDFAIKLLPKSHYGKLRHSECLFITHNNKQENLKLTYCINSNLIFSNDISKKSLEIMLNFYEKTL